jgi:hypothetical protein
MPKFSIKERAKKNPIRVKIKVYLLFKWHRFLSLFGKEFGTVKENSYSAMPFHKSLSTLPIANFDQILRTGNLNYLYKVDFFEVDLNRVVPPGFYSLLTDLIKEIDYCDNTNLRMEYEAEVKEFNYMITGDAQQINKARLLRSRLEKLKTEEPIVKQGSLSEEAAILEKDLELKMSIDIYSIPTLKYMAYKKIRREQIKRLKNA